MKTKITIKEILLMTILSNGKVIGESFQMKIVDQNGIDRIVNMVFDFLGRNVCANDPLNHVQYSFLDKQAQIDDCWKGQVIEVDEHRYVGDNCIAVKTLCYEKDFE